MILRNSPTFLTFVLLFSTVFSSCNKDDTTAVLKDSEEPEISFKALEEDSKLRGEVEIDLNVSDNSEISKVEVYFNNTLVATLSEAPYKIALNTKEYPNGSYTIKAIAFDSEGNKKEVAANITILNTLLTVNVPETAQTNYFDEKPLPRWIFISDVKGNLLGVKKYENGQKLTFEIPDDFEGDQVYFNQITISKNKMDRFTFTNVIVDNFLIDVGEEITLHSDHSSGDKVVVGNSEISVTNIPSVDTHWSSNLNFEGPTGRTVRSSILDKTLSTVIELYKSPVNGIYVLSAENGSAPKYTLYENLLGGQLYQEDYNNLSTMTGVIRFNPPPDSYNLAFLNGRRKAGDKTTGMLAGFYHDTFTNIYYPENIFEDFEFLLKSSVEGKSFSRLTTGSLIEDFEPYEVSYKVNNSSFYNYSITTDGVYDIYNLFFSDSYEEGDNYFNVSLKTMGKNSSTLTGTLPIIPDEVTEEYPLILRENLTLHNISFKEYSEMDYDEYFSYRKTLTKIPEQKSIVQVSYRIAPSNGRKSHTKERQQTEYEEVLKELKRY